VEVIMSRPETYRKFTPEFKREAVELSLQANKSVRQVAEELGLTEKLLSRWRSEQAQQGREAFRGHGRRTVEEDELARLRRENAELKMERDILKKAAAWFAKQQL
jgi:transposase-like protein